MFYQSQNCEFDAKYVKKISTYTFKFLLNDCRKNGSLKTDATAVVNLLAPAPLTMQWSAVPLVLLVHGTSLVKGEILFLLIFSNQQKFN